MKKSSKNFYWLVLAGWLVSFVVAGVSIYMKGINEKTAVVAIAAISIWTGLLLLIVDVLKAFLTGVVSKKTMKQVAIPFIVCILSDLCITYTLFAASVTKGTMMMIAFVLLLFARLRARSELFHKKKVAKG